MTQFGSTEWAALCGRRLRQDTLIVKLAVAAEPPLRLSSRLSNTLVAETPLLVRRMHPAAVLGARDGHGRLPLRAARNDGAVAAARSPRCISVLRPGIVTRTCRMRPTATMSPSRGSQFTVTLYRRLGMRG